MNKQNYSAVYSAKRTYLKFDDTHIIGYLNEKIIDSYTPEKMEGSDTEPEPYTGYQYTGTEKDGGTLMECGESASYDDIVNAIIRSEYSESEELAVHRHYANDPTTYADEWKIFNAWCESAKTIAASWTK